MNIGDFSLSTRDLLLLGTCIPLIVALAHIRHSDWLRRKNISDNDIRKFISVFVDFILHLEKKGALFPDKKIKELHNQHLRAEVELRTSLSGYAAIKFKRYWKNYRKKADPYYNAPLKLMGKGNTEMLHSVEKLIKNVKKL